MANRIHKWLFDGWEPLVSRRRLKHGWARVITSGHDDASYAYMMWDNDHPRYPHGETSEWFDNPVDAANWANARAHEYGGWD